MNKGGARSTNGSTGSGTIPPISFGMRSECLAQAATKNWDKSKLELDTGDTSKMSAKEPSTSCTVAIDQV
jgi:hypothetical protein